MQGKLKFDLAQKMKIYDNPFPKEQNIVEAKMFKGEAKVLTSARAREAGTVDPDMQISAEEYAVINKHREQKKSRCEQGESSRTSAMKPCVTSRILLNKWQWQKEKDYGRWLEEEEHLRQQEEEKYEREQGKSHWNCPFFRHCWNKGLKLPTRNNCPECSDQYQEFRQSQTNHQSIHDQIKYQHDNMDRRVKNESALNWLGKRVIDQNWIDYEEDDEGEHAWQGQWCLGGLTRSQKRRVQRLRNQELE
jgi:hypothetical protein